MEEVKQVTEKQKQQFSFSPHFIGVLADEVAKMVIARLPKMRSKPKVKKKPKQARLENAIFLDTSAIIDGRVFPIIELGLLKGMLIVPEGVLLELKHIADSQEAVKRERGRKGLEMLEQIKKSKRIKLLVLSNSANGYKPKQEVDELLIQLAKYHKGEIITCDYNLEKKATIHGLTAINIHALAQCLKISAVPGEALHVKVLHLGKDPSQGVAYLDDGSMIVVEKGSEYLGEFINVVISRVIQTASGKIFFARKI